MLTPFLLKRRPLFQAVESVVSGEAFSHQASGVESFPVSEACVVVQRGRWELA